jgi:hypothetical protein
MSAATAAFLGSGRRVRATVAPPTTVNRACYWCRNLIQLRTLGLATLESATGQQDTPALQKQSPGETLRLNMTHLPHRSNITVEHGC